MYVSDAIEHPNASLPLIVTPTEWDHIHVETSAGPSDGSGLVNFFNYTPKGYRTPYRVSLHFYRWEDGSWNPAVEPEYGLGYQYASSRGPKNVPNKVLQQIVDEVKPYLEEWANSRRGTEMLFRAAEKHAKRELEAAKGEVAKAKQNLSDTLDDLKVAEEGWRNVQRQWSVS